MCWFRKKKSQDQFEDTSLFLQEYANKVYALRNYAMENETVLKEINHVKEAYIFSIAPKIYNKRIQQHQENIKKMYEELLAMFRTREWDEKNVMFRLQDLQTELQLLLSVKKK